MHGGEAQLHLRFDTYNSTQAEIGAYLNAVLEKRGLADASFAPQDQCAAHASPSVIQEPIKPSPLGSSIQQSDTVGLQPGLVNRVRRRVKAAEGWTFRRSFVIVCSFCRLGRSKIDCGWQFTGHSLSVLAPDSHRIRQATVRLASLQTGGLDPETAPLGPSVCAEYVGLVDGHFGSFARAG
jgi:hypothetical protein